MKSFVVISLLLVISVTTLFTNIVFVEATACTFVSQRVQCAHLTCEDGMCVPCNTSAQCYNTAMECVYDDTTGVDDCKMISVAQLWAKNPGGLIGALCIAVSVCAIAVLGGVGGGGILVPLFQVTMGVSLLDAVSLSQATIVGQSTFNVLLQVRRYHPKYNPPHPTRPACNYVLLMFWLPISLIGTTWGNLLGKLVPDWFRLALLFILLSYILKRMVDRIITQRKDDIARQAEKEGKAPLVEETSKKPSKLQGVSESDLHHQHQHQALIMSGGDESSERSMNTRNRFASSANVARGYNNIQSSASQSAANMRAAADTDGATSSPAGQDSPASEEDKSGPHHQVSEGEEGNNNPKHTSGELEKRFIYSQSKLNVDDVDGGKNVIMPAYPQYPWRIYVLIICVFAPLFLSNMAKNKWVTCHNNLPGFWGLILGATAFCSIFTVCWRQHLQKIQNRIEAGEEDPEQVPFKWNTKTSIVFPILSVTAGATASLLGLGGGLILSFLFLEAGLVPEEVSATGGFATFCVALESLLQFIIQGEMRWDFCGVFVGAGVLSTAIGQLIINPYIKKKGWTFLIIVSLASIMAGSMVALTAVGIYDTIKLLDNGGSIGFGDLCPQVASAHLHHLGG